jgi:23S rRNA (cytosine1962-C5)-methyltransferase
MASPPPALPPLDVLAAGWPGYALLDSGRRRKLERFGTQIIIRGEPKAWWEPSLPDSAWAAAHAVHEDDRPWRLAPNAPREWLMQWRTLTLQARLADTSKHLGIFPEQSPHWEFIQAHGPKPHDSPFQPQTSLPSNPSAPSVPSFPSSPPLKLLNLFGYTGVASLAAAAAGFAVTHVDASKPAVAWGRHNQQLSNLAAAPIRWILDDALKFLRREIRRGVRYDAIALDPPSYGRGPNGELWKVETQLPELLRLCRQCLSEKPRFLLLTMYNLEASPLLLANLLAQTTTGLPGTITRGELALVPPSPILPLPLSLWARWESD